MGPLCRIVSTDLEHWRTPSCNDAVAAAPSLPRQRSVAAAPHCCKSAPVSVQAPLRSASAVSCHFPEKRDRKAVCSGCSGMVQPKCSLVKLMSAGRLQTLASRASVSTVCKVRLLSQPFFTMLLKIIGLFCRI